MRVDAHIQRTAGIRNRMGKPITAGTKAGQSTAPRAFSRPVACWICLVLASLFVALLFVPLSRRRK
jgi:hypothetical protein